MKYCPKCGAEWDDIASFCSICGTRIPASGYRPNNAFNENSTGNSTSYNTSNETHNETTDNSRTFGILSLVFAILGLNILGIIFGAVGLNKSVDSGSRSLCIVGLALSIIHLIVRVVIFILAAAGVTGSYFYI